MEIDQWPYSNLLWNLVGEDGPIRDQANLGL